MITCKAIREIKFEKGAEFTTEFISEFDQEWNMVVQLLRSSGTDLNIPLAKK